MTPALYASCEKAVHVVTKDGKTLQAGRACLFVLAELGWHGVARILLFPPILWFVEIGYGIVAAHRDFFAGFMFTRDHSRPGSRTAACSAGAVEYACSVGVVCYAGSGGSAAMSVIHQQAAEERRTSAPTTPVISSTLGIDRIAPTRRPPGRTVMRQQWRDLLFLHWPIEADLLRSLIPSELSIDTFEGQAYVGLVPFTMRNVRPTGLPAFAPLSNFHEINVRTYVHHNGQNPGVWFFSLDAASAVAVRIARAWFKLPYFHARMRLDREQKRTGGLEEEKEREEAGRIDYSSERLWPDPLPAYARIAWTPAGAVTQATPDTRDHFFAERYLLYSSKNGRLYRGQVHHTAYPLQTAALHSLDENLVAQAGIARHDIPPIIHYARGVDVDIYALREVRTDTGP